MSYLEMLEEKVERLNAKGILLEAQVKSASNSQEALEAWEAFQEYGKEMGDVEAMLKEFLR